MTPARVVAFAVLTGLGPTAAVSPQSGTSVPVPAEIRAAYEAATRNRNGSPGPRYWQLWPRYELTASLDPAASRVVGHGTMSVVNTSPNTLNEIVLRLDQNRFRPAAGGEHTTRGIELRTLSLNGRLVDLTGPQVSGLRTTVATVQLHAPLLAGDTLGVAMQWEYEVPAARDTDALRQGRSGQRAYQAGQWYPRLAMYDDIMGWDRAAHDGSVEFFNPFGSYYVVVNVPPGWIVGATGTLENGSRVLMRSEQDALEAATQVDTTVMVTASGAPRRQVAMTWRFRADSISDFAWGASPHYSWVVTSRTMGSRRVLVHAFATPGREAALTRATHRAADVLVALSDRIMPYAWSTHTLVDGPEGGMEYPTLTMSHGDIIEHELSHQWFPMMVGSDETRYDFLDEGFANYFAGVLTGTPGATAGTASRATLPLIDPSNLRTPRLVLGYNRGSRMLRALADRVGEARLLAALRAYSVSWRFKHPSPWDFMASMESALDESLDAFWLRWMFSRDDPTR